MKWSRADIVSGFLEIRVLKERGAPFRSRILDSCSAKIARGMRNSRPS